MAAVFTKSLLASSVVIAGLFGATASFAAPAQVHVSLFDDGMAAGMPDGLGLGSSSEEMAKATMHVKADVTSIPAGEVTFTATNDSAMGEHEMLVAKLADPTALLPYDEKRKRVDEDAAGSLGEVSELQPGQSGDLTLTLDPGTYVLFCNVPGHYMAGMWTLLEVK